MKQYQDYAIKEICFLVQTPFTLRDYRRFGIEIIKSRGLKVKILDMTQIMNPDYLAIHRPMDICSCEEIVACRNKKDIISFLRNSKNIFVINFNIGGTSNALFIYRFFKKFNIRYAAFYANNSPCTEVNVTGKKNFIAKLLDFKNLPSRLGHKLSIMLYSSPCFLSGIQPPVYILTGGARSRLLTINPRPSKTAKIISAHALDYDLYLDYEADKSLPISKEKYSVFLDEFGPYHPAFYVFRGALNNPYPEPEKYYRDLNRFLSQIEGITGIPVIIAAHPRSRYEDKGDLFNGRKVIKDKTIELVANAQFVLAHSSTSINFAVLYKKPIIFLTSKEMETNFWGDFIANFAKQFEKRPFNISEVLKLKLDDELKINHKLYAEFEENYIKTRNSPQLNFWDIVLDSVLN